MLRLYKTMTRSVDEFVPIQPPQVGLYTCGPTVYHYAHIGNLRTYVFEDILKRTLAFCGFKVRHVMNVTDVGHLISDADEGEDKMELGAKREGRSAWELADFYWQAFRSNLADLNILEPDLWCKATDHIQEQIEQIQALERKGFTYAIADGVYFDTSKLKDYGKLARLDREDLKAGARIEMVEGKRNLTDFALWKLSPKGQKRQMEWDSPWGVGFPGWHIECSAMAMKYLGDRFDIHCGGVDHIKVHHTNEIAQAEGVTGKPWVNWWMHGEFLVLESADKMSKSAENFITLDTVKERGIDPLAYRYFCLNAHYRKQLTFSWEALQGAASGFARLKHAVIELKDKAVGTGKAHQEHLATFTEAVQDDLNMPRALAAMWGLLRDANASPADQYATLLKMDGVLGFGFEAMQAQAVSMDDEVHALLDERERARKNRDFKAADRIRDALLAKGLVIEDTPQGPKVKQKA
ncbi:MAG TPA: cysteine--tRNA ligase [Candidatus Bipolaricaulota bacterium]